MRIRTSYSFRVAAGMIEKVMERVVEINLGFAPISDRASTFGFNRWSKLAAKNNLKPIFGLELAVSPSISASKPVTDYWTFFAKQDLAELNKLLFTATNQFRYEPLLNYDQANNAEGVIKIIGNRANLDLVKNDENTFLALSPSMAKGYFKDAHGRGFKFIATSDNKFPKKEDKSFYEVVAGSSASTQTYPQWILNEEEWRTSVSGFADQETVESALNNMKEVAELCNAKLKKGTLLSPEKKKTLREMCIEGAKKLGIDLTDEVYSQRLDRELKLIADKKFEDYFYIIADLMQWSRQRMLCGPARGSSCGSLVCYLLEITTIDPIPYDLLFERFIDITRNDLPDIDIDFSDQNRHLAFEYMEQKYGKEHVARLGTVALYRPRSAIDEAGAALDVPPWKYAKVLDSLIVRSSGDSRALQTLEDTLVNTPAGKELMAEYPELIVSTKMEGHPKHYSQHAAGVVVTEDPILDYVAIDARTGATQCDKKDAEDLNLLKIDALGLTQLSVFEDALLMAGKSIHYLEKVPLNDAAAFEVFNKKQFSGIFQFNGPALQSICNQIDVASLEDIVAITALARPGPMASGGTNEWVKRKNGKKVEYPHPAFEPYLNKTLGIVTYQEDVMKIGREIGGLSWEDVTALRKAMSKSLGKEYFDQFGNKFKVGAIQKGIDGSALDKIWDDLCAYGSWCISGSTKLENPYPSQHLKKWMTVKDLFNRQGRTEKISEWEKKNSGLPKKQKLFSMSNGSIKPVELLNVVYSGKKETFTLTLQSRKIRATKEHQFYTPDGWKALKDIKVGMSIAVQGGKQPSERKKPSGTGSGRHNWRQAELDGLPFYKTGKKILKTKFKKCQECLFSPYEETHHINGDHKDHRIENLKAVCRKCHKRLHKEAGIFPIPQTRGRAIEFEVVKSIKLFGSEDVYDIAMPAPNHNFIANGIVTHNCFNRSHAVAYGIVSYWCAYMKAHFPFEFAAATLSHEENPAKQIMILREMADEGITYIPVDKDLSTDKWTAADKEGKRVLVGPLSNVKGIGPKLVQQIIGARARSEPMPAKFEKLMRNPKTEIDSLSPIKDAFKRLMPNPQERNIFTPPSRVIDLMPKGEEYPALVFGVLQQIKPRDENEAVNIAKRNGKVLTGPTMSLNMTLADDTDRIFAKINRFQFEEIGRAIVDRGRPGKALYAMKGTVPRDFRMLSVKNVRFIGFLDE